MLAALLAGFLVIPVLAADAAIDQDAVALAASVGDDLSGLAPNFNVDGIVDPVAILVLALHDAACKVADHGSAVKGAKRRISNDANDAGCVKAHGWTGVMLLASSKARICASG